MGGEPLSASTSVTLFCAKLNIEIEFNLDCGSFARIGSGQDMEITIPISGVKDFELKLDRDATGHLIASDGANTHVVTEETGLYIGSHHFTLRPSRAPVPSFHHDSEFQIPENHQVFTQPSQPSVHAPWHGLGDKAKLLFAGFLLAIGVITASFLVKERSVSGNNSTSTQSSDSAKALEPSIESSPDKPQPLPVAHGATPKSRDLVDWSRIAEEVKKSVFQLNVLNEHGQPYALGTAFCMEPGGYLITNAHVIRGSESFEAVTAQGAIFKVTNVRHFDEAHDLAVLEIEAREWTGLKLAGPDRPKVGDPVAAYGSPKGMQGTFSEGVVSALRPGSDLGEKQMGDLIQISAPISNGSSGSPVLNAQGEVIGVATLVLRSSQNMNFAVPVSALKQLLETKPLSKGEFESQGALANQQANSEKKDIDTLPTAPSPDQQFASDPESQGFEIAKKASNWIEAFRIAKSLVSRHPESSTAHFEMGFAASELSLHEVALRSYQESIARDPESSSAWNNLGCVYGILKKPLDAEKAFARAAELEPSDILAWTNLARFRVVNKKWAEASQALMALAQVDKSASDKFLADIQKVFSRSWPEGLHAMTASYRARYPLATSDPESLGKKLAARFLSFGAGDNVDAELRSYADVVEPYFGEARKEAREILKDLIEYRRKWPARSYDLNGFESAKLNSSKNLLIARYSFVYQVAGNGKQRKGIIKQETTFFRISEDFWIVKGVRTLSSSKEE